MLASQHIRSSEGCGLWKGVQSASLQERVCVHEYMYVKVSRIVVVAGN